MSPRVHLDWRKAHLLTTPRPCVLCRKPATLLSPGKGVACHKTCAEHWRTQRAPPG